MEILDLIWKFAQLQNGFKSLFKWLAEAFGKSWPTEKKLEMPDILCFSVDERILRFREIAMLKGYTV